MKVLRPEPALVLYLTNRWGSKLPKVGLIYIVGAPSRYYVNILRIWNRALWPVAFKPLGTSGGKRTLNLDMTEVLARPRCDSGLSGMAPPRTTSKCIPSHSMWESRQVLYTYNTGPKYPDMRYIWRLYLES